MAVPKTAALPLGDAPVFRWKKRDRSYSKTEIFCKRADCNKKTFSVYQEFHIEEFIGRQMKIIQIASEFAPIAKAGGLGEVILGLSRELSCLGHDVTVCIPKYSFITPSSLHQLKAEKEFRCGSIPNTLWSASYEECQLRLLEARHPSGYFHRDRIYGYEDDVPRFLYFSRAIMEWLRLEATPIDILHLHDWHTAACALLAKDLFKLKIGKIVFTIHNLEYQGKCATWDLDAIDLDGLSYLKEEKLQDPAYPQTINLLKGGINYSDAANTVSPSYAKEIILPKMGWGLHEVLKKKNVKGILNGIDTKLWNSAKDSSLSAHYSPEDSLVKITKSKAANKAALKGHYGLDASLRPLVGAVTRLASQKGTDLLLAAASQILELGGCFALLGSTPDPKIQSQFEALKERYQHTPQIFLQYEYNEKLAHELYAACDFLLVPSLHEPCGLTQLVALRYGTIPIVRSTGGLKDTVFDCENPQTPHEKRNGFVFSEPTPEAQKRALQRALALWKNEKETFQNMTRSVMQQDYSWKLPAKEYLKLYQKKTLLEHRKAS